MSTSSTPADTAYPGQRLGRPPTGPGSVASWRRRILALCVDWFASLAVAGGLTGGAALSSQGWAAWLPMLVFLVEASTLTPLIGGSFGQVLTRVAVVRLDGGPVSLLAAVVRTTMICLVVPPVVYNRDKRGLHDLLVGTLTVQR
ncbi:MAG TPA: RDD family protein [Nocardioidaceae bacterium]|nr:RDD family protein [Nocardioidaceae bacterium]